MFKTHIEKGLSYFSVSLGVLSALAGVFILGTSFVTAGQRAPYSAGTACLGSALLPLIIAASFFRKVGETQRFTESF